MLIRTDNHFHSTYSHDARSSLAAMINRQHAMGLEVVTSTEHFDADPADGGFGFYSYEKVRDDIIALRKEFRIKILHGIEVTFQPKYLAGVEDFLSQNSFDLIIGAVHYIEGILIRHWAAAAGDGFTPYFDLMLELSLWGGMNVLGHLDYIKKYSSLYIESVYFGKIESILQNIIEKDIALGVNTSGYRQIPGEQYPSRKILAMYKDMGGRLLSIGSDSHHLSQIGTGYGETAVLLKSLGFREYHFFVSGQPCSLVL